MSESNRSLASFPDRLREAREQRQLNQGELAEKAGLQASAISHFETGTRKPSFDNLRRLADALKVTTDYLLGRVNHPEELAGADRLHRNIERLSAADRVLAEGIIEQLAERNKTSHRKSNE